MIGLFVTKYNLSVGYDTPAKVKYLYKCVCYA